MVVRGAALSRPCPSEARRILIRVAGETFGLIADLMRVFPQATAKLAPQEVDAMARLYARELADLPPGLLEEAVRDLIRTERWFPTIAAIRERTAERALALPEEAGALAQVEERMRWGRLDDSERPAEPPEVHPLVRAAVDHVGGFHAFRETQEAAVLRGQFGRLYREMRARAIHEYVLEPLRPAGRVS